MLLKIDRQIARNKNYKKYLETRFSIGNQKNLINAFEGDLVFDGGLWDPTTLLAKLVLDLFHCLIIRLGFFIECLSLV